MSTIRMTLSMVRIAGEKLSGITCKGKTATAIGDVQVLLQVLESILEGCVLAEEGGSSTQQNS